MQDSRLIRLLEKIEMFLYRRARRVVVVTNSFKMELIERGIDADKIDVVINGVDLAKYQPAKEKDKALAQQYSLRGKFVVAYIGTQGLAHAWDKILDASSLPQAQQDICFLFAGGGALAKNCKRQWAVASIQMWCLFRDRPRK